MAGFLGRPAGCGCASFACGLLLILFALLKRIVGVLPLPVAPEFVCALFRKFLKLCVGEIDQVYQLCIALSVE